MRNIRHYKESIKRHVLIVEDDFVNQQILGQIIASEFEPLYADNGEQALKILKETDHNISLVLLALNLPKISGFELLNIMLGDETLKRIPVIALTNERSEEIRSLQLGAQDFISPFPAPRRPSP